MADELSEDTLADAAAGPRQASSDAGSMQSQDLIQLAQVLDRKSYVDSLAGSNSKGGPKSGWAGLRIARAEPPGAC